MKTKKLKLHVIILLLLPLCAALLGAGCEDDNRNYSNIELYGTWKFIAFGKTDGSIINVQHDACPGCYILTFKKDSTIEGKSVLNTLGKNFILSENQLIFPNGVLATEILEEGAPLRFTTALENVQSFKIEESHLKLFYSDDDFLLFKFKSNLP